MPNQRISLLDRSGEIIQNVDRQGAKKFNSANTIPVMIDYYLWDKKKQLQSSEKYKDQIKRVFYPEKVDKKVKDMVQDDINRLLLVKSFNYGKRVLEVGCSDGSVSIKIAENPRVKEIIGIDFRQSAINDGKNLIKNLLKKKVINQKVAKKVKLIKSTVEGFSTRYGKFDSVCAYEIFEHLTPQDLMPTFQHLYKFIKKDGNFFISVPNRFPHQKYVKSKRSRWKWHDHRNFFSQLSLELFFKNFFRRFKFSPLYKGEKISDGIYLIVECKEKKYDS